MSGKSFRKRWCVQHIEGWCIRKDESKEARKAEDFTATETLCERWITLPGGMERRRPTCEECKAVERQEA